jgi:hypothetical protein
MPEPAVPLSVQPSEEVFLRLARSLVGLSPPSTGVDVLVERHRPVELGSNAMTALKEILSKGLLLALVRRGGHASRRSTRSDGSASKRGRLWERHPPPDLRFSAATMDLLRALHEQPLGEVDIGSEEDAPPLTAADEAFYLLAATACAAVAPGGVRRLVVAGRSGLVRAAFPLAFATSTRAADFTRLCDGAYAIVVEAMRSLLASHVFGIDAERRTFRDPALASRVATAIERGPRAFVERCIAAKRPDLGLFVLDGVRRLLEARAAGGSEYFVVRAAPGATLEQRQQLARGIVPLFETALRYRAVASAAQASGFVDEDYDASQALLEQLEPWIGGDFDRAASVVRELSSFGGESGILQKRS